MITDEQLSRFKACPKVRGDHEDEVLHYKLKNDSFTSYSVDTGDNEVAVFLKAESQANSWMENDPALPLMVVRLGPCFYIMEDYFAARTKWLDIQ